MPPAANGQPVSLVQQQLSRAPSDMMHFGCPYPLPQTRLGHRTPPNFRQERFPLNRIRFQNSFSAPRHWPHPAPHTSLFPRHCPGLTWKGAFPKCWLRFWLVGVHYANVATCATLSCFTSSTLAVTSKRMNRAALLMCLHSSRADGIAPRCK